MRIANGKLKTACFCKIKKNLLGLESTPGGMMTKAFNILTDDFDFITISASAHVLDVTYVESLAVIQHCLSNCLRLRLPTRIYSR